MTGAGDGFWYISQEISNKGGELGSRRKDEVAVPETDWDYKLDGKWLEDDNTLTVSAQNRSDDRQNYDHHDADDHGDQTMTMMIIDDGADDIG